MPLFQHPRINFHPLRNALISSVREVLTKLRPELTVKRELHSLGRTKKETYDQTRDIDVLALELYTSILSSKLPGTSALVCSEENPTGSNLTSSAELPDLIFIIDPIDNTDGAIHGEPCYTAVSVYLRSAGTVIAAAVGDFFLNEIYYSDDDMSGASRYLVTNVPEETVALEIKPSGRQTISGAYIAMYTLKPKRMIDTARASDLLMQLGEEGRVDCIGGAAALCKVAAGYIDAAVEFSKGFQVYDLFPGAYILAKAGGVCYRPDTGDSVSLSLPFETQDQLPVILKQRQPFIAASTGPLYTKILHSLTRNNLINVTDQ